MLEDGANGDHTRGTSTWLTGVHPGTPKAPTFMSGHLGRPDRRERSWARTQPLPSLELSIDLSYLRRQLRERLRLRLHEHVFRGARPPRRLPTENNPRSCSSGCSATAGRRRLSACARRERTGAFSIRSTTTCGVFSRHARTRRPDRRQRLRGSPCAKSSGGFRAPRKAPRPPFCPRSRTADGHPEPVRRACHR